MAKFVNALFKTLQLQNYQAVHALPTYNRGLKYRTSSILGILKSLFLTRAKGFGGFQLPHFHGAFSLFSPFCVFFTASLFYRLLVFTASLFLSFSSFESFFSSSFFEPIKRSRQTWMDLDHSLLLPYRISDVVFGLVSSDFDETW